MLVLKTTSPKVVPLPPKGRPVKSVPSSRASFAIAYAMAVSEKTREFARRAAHAAQRSKRQTAYSAALRARLGNAWGLITYGRLFLMSDLRTARSGARR